MKQWRRLLCLGLAAILLLGTAPVFAARTPYADVAADSWYSDAVAAFSEQGYVQGVSPDRFDPNGAMSRAMVVTILCRMSGEGDSGARAAFTDVPADAWFAGPVAWAVSHGVTQGVGDGRFDPEAGVTREQFVTLLWRYAADRFEPDFERYYAEQSYPDSDPVSDWALRAMRLSVGSGVLRGRSVGGTTVLDARAGCTRAEAVTMLYRFTQLALTDREPSVPEVTEAQLDALAASSLKLFSAMVKPGESLAASPLSAIFALAMLDLGAEGETRSQLDTLFGMDAAELAETLSALAACLPDGTGTMRLANSLWVNETADVRQDYLSRTRAALGAEVFSRRFDSDTLRELNDWVRRQTDGMIPAILRELDPQDLLVLLNTLLFRANWEETVSQQTELPFHAADGSVKTVPMLRSAETTYLRDENAVGFRKPFRGGRYAFAVLVPREGITPVEWLNTLDGAALRALLRGEEYDRVYAVMPRFQTAWEGDLLPVFARAGLTDLTHLGGIAPRVGVTQAIHKTVIDVNENGVSAAAATAIVVSRTAKPDQGRVATVIADRPYVYMIVDTVTNLPLFLGINESIQ